MIPSQHRADEFHLSLDWAPRVNGVIPATPGFYLRAQFANEAMAEGVVPGTWLGGRGGGNGSLVRNAFLIDLMKLLHREGLLVEGQGVELGEDLANYAQSARDAALEAKRARLVRLREEVAELEEALEE
jgi:hypothetical protein